jgi:hypothetical protein
MKLSLRIWLHEPNSNLIRKYRPKLMSSEAGQASGRGANADSGDYTYRLVKTSLQTLTAAAGDYSGVAGGLRGLESDIISQKHTFDLTSPGHLIGSENWESVMKVGLQKLCTLLTPWTKNLQFLQIDVLQDTICFMEEYVKQKLNLKMDALADFFGVMCDREQQLMFRALMRTYSNKLRVIDKQEIEKMKSLYKTVIGKSLASCRSFLEEIANEDHSRLCFSLSNEQEEGILKTLDTRDFEETLHCLNEASLLLLLSYHSQGFGVQPKESRVYRVKLFNESTMINLYDIPGPNHETVSTRKACIEVSQEIKLLGKEVTFKPFVFCLGEMQHFSLLLDVPSSMKSIVRYLSQAKGSSQMQVNPVENCHDEAEEEDYSFLKLKPEKMITFEGSNHNLRSRIEGRQKKSVTFSDRDSVFEFDPITYSHLDKEKRNFGDKKPGDSSKLAIENKENRPNVASSDRQNRKVLNLKELQLNPKQFIGKRHNKAPKLRLIHDSEESIESLKPGENKALYNRPASPTESYQREPTGNTSMLKNLNISKNDVQNKLQYREPCSTKGGLKDTPMYKELMANIGKGAPIIHIELPSGLRPQDRSNLSHTLQSERNKFLTDLTRKSQNRETQVPQSDRNKNHSLHYRSSSAQNLDRAKHSRSNVDFISQITKRSHASNNLSEVSNNNSGGQFGRSLSAGRRMLSSVLKPSGKDQSITSITDSFMNHPMLTREDKVAAKSNVISSKLNFLTYDKQSVAHNFYSMKAKEKGGIQLDLSIYQKILCGRSKAMPHSTKNASSRIR